MPGSRAIPRPVVAGFVLAFGTAVTGARAQSPAGPILPPLPFPPIPLPLPVAPLSGNPAQPAPSPPSDAPVAATGAALPAQRLLSTNSAAELDAWRSSQIHEVWYGWQTLAVDAGAVGSLLVGTTFHEGPAPLATTAVAIYGTGPVVIHLAHGSVGSGLGSLAVRIGLPFVGYLAGTCLQRWNMGGSESGTIGFVVGAGAAAAGDAAFLGWDRWRGSDGPAPASMVALSGSY